MEIKVSENDGVLSLDVDGCSQGRVDLEGRPVSPYVNEMLSAIHYVQAEKPRVLCIGLGPGIIPSYLWRAYSLGCDVIEPSSLILDIAKTQFGYKQHGTIHPYDGSVGLKRTEGKYDLIFLDAYNGIEKPAHLYSKGFYRDCHNKLNPGGFLVINYVSTSGDECFKNQEKLQAVFSERVRSTSNKDICNPFNAVFFAQKE